MRKAGGAVRRGAGRWLRRAYLAAPIARMIVFLISIAIGGPRSERRAWTTGLTRWGRGRTGA